MARILIRGKDEGERRESLRIALRLHGTDAEVYYEGEIPDGLVALDYDHPDDPEKTTAILATRDEIAGRDLRQRVSEILADDELRAAVAEALGLPAAEERERRAMAERDELKRAAKAAEVSDG